MRIAIYAGTFDPIHHGHMGIIKRASRLFDQLIVGIGVNEEKKTMWDIEDRRDMVWQAVSPLDNVEVVPFSGLTSDFAKKQRAHFLVRGLRAVSDFDYEFQMSLMNKKLDKELDTVFIMAPLSYMYLSSSMIRGVWMSSGSPADIEGLVPDVVLGYLR